jgi:ATP-dependent RNA helicase DDX3X
VAGLNFEKYEEMPVETSEEMPTLNSFADCEVHPTMLANVERLQYTAPTPVQKYTIPISLMRRDLMACAMTGSGKTVSYLFPILTKMLKDGPPTPVPGRGRKGFPVSVVLSPTRELACQIYEETVKLAAKTGIRTVLIHGGTEVRP